MRKHVSSFGLFLFLLCLSTFVPSLQATIFGSIRGVVHDPQHRPISGVEVTLKSATSAWSQTVHTEPDGSFSFSAVPLGDYVVTVTKSRFANERETVTLNSDSSPILHIQLKIATVNQTATVSAEAQEQAVNIDSVTPITLVDRKDIALTPGADRSNSLQMITDYVPGSYFTHDQLHIRGGHQVSWLIDGVPIPNTISRAIWGPKSTQKDIDYLEIQRGGYSADYGDRTYGVFNVVPRSGFERDNEAELVMTLGNWYQTNDQLSFSGHTQKFAYYASLNGNRSNLGLQTPIGQVFHDAENGYGGFGTFLYNLDTKDQLRLVTQLRKDYHPVPNPDFDSSGLRDGQHETDGFVAFTWVHTFDPNKLLTVSPFYHRNIANYDANPNDTPQVSTDNRTSNYIGAQSAFNVTFARNNLRVGFYGFKQYDNEFFNLIFNDGSGTPRSLTAKALPAARSPDSLTIVSTPHRGSHSSPEFARRILRERHFPTQWSIRSLKTRSIPGSESLSEFPVSIGLFVPSTAITIRPLRLIR